MEQTASSALSVGLSLAANPVVRPGDTALRQLREEYQVQRALFRGQPPGVQQFVSAQAAQVAEALVQRRRQVHFELPEHVVVKASPGDNGITPVPVEFRKQMVGGLFNHLPTKDIRTAVRRRLAQLEWSPYRAVAVSAQLVRYATVTCLVHEMTPQGNPVTYVATEGEEIPTWPAGADPSLPPAGRFYMPEWVAFEDGRLLVASPGEAEACIASMQDYMSRLHLAVSLAPYIFADEEYQRKHYGMLGQLVNQGRALAYYQTGVVVGKIKRYAQEGKLGLGFSLSLPYFDDQALEIKMCDFQVTPPGRIMFTPALVWRAACQEQDKVKQDARLSRTTRLHLLAQLQELAQAFDTRPRR